MPTETPTRPQRDIDPIRMVAPGPALRAVAPAAGAEDATDGMPTLFGHFLRFNEWTVIDSYWEGKFLERIAPGAAKKTIREQGPRIRCLFQHGYDPQIGDKPLGPFDVLAEDAEGVAYEVPLLDTQYNRELIPGLEAGLYGASFRMRVLREEVDEEPGVSDHNPDGLPERTIKEVRLFEGGPVTFPAYDNATAAVRSLTDHFIFDALTRDPERLRELVGFAERCEARLGQTRSAGETGDGSVEERADTTSTEETTHAPSKGAAGVEPHGHRERRGKHTPPLFGAITRRSSEPWRLSR